VPGEDVDGDGLANWVDTDADGDGTSDGDEGRVDVDQDGIRDYLDPSDAVFGVYRGSGLAVACGCRSGPAGGLAVLPLLVLAVRRRRK
jgi:MYXO-CTERM domain-containing protein